jgi:hypothetical protein
MSTFVSQVQIQVQCRRQRHHPRLLMLGRKICRRCLN